MMLRIWVVVAGLILLLVPAAQAQFTAYTATTGCFALGGPGACAEKIAQAGGRLVGAAAGCGLDPRRAAGWERAVRRQIVNAAESVEAERDALAEYDLVKRQYQARQRAGTTGIDCGEIGAPTATPAK